MVFKKRPRALDESRLSIGRVSITRSFRLTHVGRLVRLAQIHLSVQLHLDKVSF